MYRVYYAAFVKDPSATGAPPTPYKIVDVQSEPAPAVTTAEVSTQQQATSFSYPATHPVASTFQNSIPGVTSAYSVPTTQPSFSNHQPPVSQVQPLPMPEATQLPQPGSDVNLQSTTSLSYQSSAPPPGGLQSSNWNDPPVVVKAKKVGMFNSNNYCCYNYSKMHIENTLHSPTPYCCSCNAYWKCESTTCCRADTSWSSSYSSC